MVAWIVLPARVLMNRPVDLLGEGIMRGSSLASSGLVEGWKRYMEGQSTVRSEWSMWVPHHESSISSGASSAGREEEGGRGKTEPSRGNWKAG